VCLGLSSSFLVSFAEAGSAIALLPWTGGSKGGRVLSHLTQPESGRMFLVPHSSFLSPSRVQRTFPPVDGGIKGGSCSLAQPGRNRVTNTGIREILTVPRLHRAATNI